MSERISRQSRSTIDKDLDKFTYVEEATAYLSRSYVTLGFGLLFLIVTACVAALFFSDSSHWLLLTAALVLGGYMALNIGANDVANNMGPAVGGRVLTMGSALVLAAICESAGALLAGSEVVTTISSRIIDLDSFARPADFPLAMLAALVAAALWINLATVIGAPVSTTHAVVGGVLGAGFASAGVSALDGGTIAAIAASWVVSPLLGAFAAAGCLALIKNRIMYRDDKIAAARCWLPVLFALLAGTFTLYLVLIGLPPARTPGALGALAIGMAAALGAYLLAVPFVGRAAHGLENRNSSLRQLFRVPLIAAAAILSFAHGANDVANAVGPVAAIFSALDQENWSYTGQDFLLPVLLVGALGISLGLLLFGAETDPHGRRADHPAEPDPRLLRAAGDRRHRAAGQRAGASRLLHPHCRRCRVRRRLLPRMVHEPHPHPPRSGADRRCRRDHRRQLAPSGAGGPAPPQAGAPRPCADHRQRLGGDRAGGRASGRHRLGGLLAGALKAGACVQGIDFQRARTALSTPARGHACRVRNDGPVALPQAAGSGSRPLA